MQINQVISEIGRHVFLSQNAKYDYCHDRQKNGMFVLVDSLFSERMDF